MWGWGQGMCHFLCVLYCSGVQIETWTLAPERSVSFLLFWMLSGLKSLQNFCRRLRCSCSLSSVGERNNKSSTGDPWSLCHPGWGQVPWKGLIGLLIHRFKRSGLRLQTCLTPLALSEEGCLFPIYIAPLFFVYISLIKLGPKAFSFSTEKRPPARWNWRLFWNQQNRVKPFLSS